MPYIPKLGATHLDSYNIVRKWIAIALITLTTSAFCQENKTVLYSQLLKEIYQAKPDSVMYRNTIFKNDLAEIKDRASFLKYIDGLGIKKNSNGYYQVDKKIRFSSCVFLADLFFARTVFNGSVYFDETKFPNQSLYADRLDNSAYLTFDSCHFKNKLLFAVFNKSLPIFNLDISSCSINNSFWYLEMSAVNIRHSQFTESFKINLEKNSSIRVDSSDFQLKNKAPGKIGNYEGDGFTEITYCSFTGSDSSVVEIASASKQTNIENNVFGTDTQMDLKQTALTLSNNAIDRRLGLDLSKTEESIFIDTKSLKELDFGLFIDERPWDKPIWRFYDGTTQNQIEDEKTFKHYFKIYKTLYDYFKMVGDMPSANKTYVKIKELETRAIKLNYEKHSTFKNFFSLSLNRLLKVYTNYGTDPAQAILISFYVVILFGVFYFFFPSDWDATSKPMLIQRFKDFIEKNEKGYFKPFLQLAVGFFSSLLNAVTLSLNAFTTLGFGNIPTHGIARYVCVLQGFIGWFLLSIFTVALINQAQF